MMAVPSRIRSPSLPWWPYALALVLTLTVRSATAKQVAGPENLDAEYYLLVAQNLVHGKGFAVDALWHGLRRTAEGIGGRLRARSRGVVSLLVPCLAVIFAFSWGQAIARAEIASNHRWHRQRGAIATWVEAHAAPQEVLMCNVGIGVTWLTGRPTVTIPFGGMEEVLAAASQFNAQVLIVSELRPQALSTHTLRDYATSPGLALVERWEGTLVYRFLPPKA